MFVIAAVKMGTVAQSEWAAIYYFRASGNRDITKLSYLQLMQKSYVYIMTNKYRTVLYIGVTADIQTRVSQHKAGEGSLFTKRFNCHYLVYYEEYNDITLAIGREKQLKHWNRAWKQDLIKQMNPEMVDLSAGW